MTQPPSPHPRPPAHHPPQQTGPASAPASRDSATTVDVAPARHTLLLAVGRCALLVGAVAVVVLGAVYAATLGPPARGEFRTGLGESAGTMVFVVGLVALAAGQAMSLHTLWITARAISARRLTVDCLVRAAHRSEWSMALSFVAAFVSFIQIIDPPPPPILASVAVLLLAAPPLDQIQAIWTYQQIRRATPAGQLHLEYRLLPPGYSDLIRLRQRAAALILVVFAGFDAILLVVTVVTETGRLLAAPAPAIVQIAAAAAAILLPLLYIPPIRRMRSAINRDAAHLPTLARAARQLTHVTRFTAALTVPVIAATLLTPAVVHLAAARPAMLAVAIGLAASPQFASLTYVHFGAPQATDLHRLQRNPHR
jgi:hypothetical protein